MLKLTSRSLYPFCALSALLAIQRHAEELASNSSCGFLYYSENYNTKNYGESLFMCYTANDTYDCYNPAFAMEYMCEFLFCGWKRNAKCLLISPRSPAVRFQV